MPLATLPSKQGLKRTSSTKYFRSSRYPLATLPSKQGLKPSSTSCDVLMCRPLATLPSKQGLKPRKRKVVVHETSSSCYTSIKTRIETHKIPTRQYASASPSCYTSIKTRIETVDAKNPPGSEDPGLLLHFHQNKD